MFSFLLLLVVRKMGILAQTSYFQNNSDEIPEYAKDFEEEWLYIRWINNKCEDFLMALDFSRDILNSPLVKSIKHHIKKFFKDQECGRLKDISSFYFKNIDVNCIECLEEQLDNYRDYYVNPDSYEFDQGEYNSSIDIDYPGFKEFFELVSLLNDKIKKEDPIIIFDSGSESDSDIESD